LKTNYGGLQDFFVEFFRGHLCLHSDTRRFPAVIHNIKREHQLMLSKIARIYAVARTQDARLNFSISAAHLRLHSKSFSFLL
jgi:hypothetical protein